MKRPIWVTLPNLLSISRIPLGGLVWIRPWDPAWVLGLMLVAGVTDVMDGAVERRRERLRAPGTQGSPTIGVWLDPLCDKIFILLVVTAVIVSRHLPLWLIPLISLREILQTVVLVGIKPLPPFRERLRPRFRANLLGKGVTVVQFLAIGSAILDAPGRIPLAIACGVLGALAVGVYVARAMRRPRIPP